MFEFPDTEKKLKNRITKYKRELQKEKNLTGYINDGFGKRYLLFCFYFVIGDFKNADDYFEWYKEKFPDDMGEPIQKLCWALSLHRMGKNKEAKYRLADLMLSNLYMIPHLLCQEIERYDIWHGISTEELEYVDYIFDEVKEAITDSDLQWMEELYHSSEFTRIRDRYIEIYGKLKDTRVVEERRKLREEAESLLEGFV
ncbi:MAG: hypothetical protein U5P10_16415 [Spirochaetia bacterium]|nr:hypothetical protein [Spirochaetia bacterium]